jgi:mono/diheme cytochrome c family protein
VWVSACTKTQKNGAETNSDTSPEAAEKIALIQRGRAMYVSICGACHNMNPKIDGALGPAIAGSSLELLEARVLFAKYPEGYKPKRETKLMVALPQFKNDLPAIHAYLNSLQ